MIPKVSKFQNFAILGETDCGKTHLAKAVAAAWLERKRRVLYIQRAGMKQPNQTKYSIGFVTIIAPNQLSEASIQDGLIYCRKTFQDDINKENVSRSIIEIVDLISAFVKGKNQIKPLVVLDESFELKDFQNLLNLIVDFPVQIIVIAQSPEYIDSRPVHELGWSKFFNFFDDSLWKKFGSLIFTCSSLQQEKYEIIFPKMKFKVWKKALERVNNAKYYYIADNRYRLYPLYPPNDLMRVSNYVVSKSLLRRAHSTLDVHEIFFNSLATQQIFNEISKIIS